MRTLKNLFFFFCLFMFTDLYATTWHVPDSISTIQAGIYSSASGDTVLVQPGTYNESGIVFNRNIVVGSLFLTTGDTSYISSTIINSPAQTVVIFPVNLDSTAVLTGFTITGANNTTGFGGGIRCTGASPTIAYNIIRDNRVSASTAPWGGGIFIEYGSSAKIIHNQIINNTAEYNASDEFGGGIYCTGSDPLIAHNIISNNFAEINGGGVYFYNSQVRLFNNTISNNSSQSGGGIYCDGNSTGIISGNTIFADSANWYGGGIHIAGNSNVEIKNNVLHSNWSPFSGGLYSTGSVVTIINNTFCYNESPNGTAALYYISSADTICNNVFFRNIGHTIITLSGHLEHCDLYGNNGVIFSFPPPAGTGVLTTVNSNGDSCDVYGNILMDPLFADTSNMDFHLSENSPCIDAGSPYLPLDPDNTTSDMGAYYFNQFRPLITTSTSLLDFGIVDIGQSLNLPFMIRNNGTAALNIQDISNNNDVFSPNWSSGDNLVPAGDSLEVIVTFTPTDSNLVADSLIIENDDKPVLVKLSGQGCIVDAIEDKSELPKLYALYPANPNPFNPSTSIEFDLPRYSDVELKIYNILGEEIITLISKSLNAGRHKYIWNANNLASGLYLYRLKAGEYNKVRKIILVR